jgi:hypothetical protein
MWEPRRLATLWASTACYRDSFTFRFLPVYSSLIKNLRHLRITVRNKNYVNEESNNRLIRRMFAAIHFRTFCLSSAIYKLKDLNIRNLLISPIVMQARETWSPILTGVLRRIFGRNTDEVIGDWTKPRSEGLHNLYSSPSIIRMIKSRRM